jgi:inosine-uridine nucleoside N-ribohydrolase
LALLDVLHGLDGPATLVTLGPLTNLARALERDSALVKARVERHLGMFGALAARGTAHRLADFNAWSDPEAAMLVLAAALPSTMVPLDVTRRFALSTARIARLAGANDPLAAWLGTALEFYLEAQRRTHGAEACVVHDVVPLGEALAPGLVSVEARSIEVGLDDGEHRGHTREHPRGAATHVATGLDAARLHGMLDRALGVM